MTGIYHWATWLAPALRKDPFVAQRLMEVPGWQTRGRPPADFNFLPSGTLCHHTACMARVGHDPQACLNGILAGNASAPGPISQLLGTWTPPGAKWNGSNPDPRILIVAAGRSNHAGTGTYPWGAPGGNGSSIGIEWCGPSEVSKWPDIVIELYERVNAAILRHNGWAINQVTTHWEYATPSGRKIDPSGPYVGEPTIAWNKHWDPNEWRARILRRMVPPPIDVVPNPPTNPPTLLEDNMQLVNPPRRAYDSRVSNSQMKAGETRVVNIGLGAGVKAAFINVSAVSPAGAGYLTVWDKGKAPATASVNFTTAESIANGVIVPVADGKVTVFASTKCHLILDVAATWS